MSDYSEAMKMPHGAKGATYIDVSKREPDEDIPSFMARKMNEKRAVLEANGEKVGGFWYIDLNLYALYWRGEE